MKYHTQLLYLTSILCSNINKMDLAKRLLLAVLLLLSVTAADNLQKEVQIPDAQPKLGSQRSSIFQSLFGKLDTTAKQSDQSDSALNERSIFKGLQSLNRFRGDDQLDQGQNDLELPYQALLPRRRKPLDFKLQNAEKLFGLMDQKLKQTPLDGLVTGLKTNGQNEEATKWQNPVFTSQQNGDLLPFFKIFGKTRNRRSKALQQISESKIQSLLIKKAPFLQGGKIVKMVSNQHKKGVFLNIQFQDKDEKMYNIIARYGLKRDRFEIISIKLKKYLTKTGNQLPALEDQSLQSKPQQIQNQLKQKQEELKLLHEKLQKMEELNKALSAKATLKEEQQTKSQQAAENKAFNQAVDIKKEVPTKQTSKVIEDKKVAVQQKKEQKKFTVEPSNLSSQQKTKSAEATNILNQ